METFRPGDRVVAVNINMTGPIRPPANPSPRPFHFPDGPLRRDVVYHVEATFPPPLDHQAQGVRITGLRVMWGPEEVEWDGSRFRKVEELGHPPLKVRRRQPRQRSRTQTAQPA